MGITFWGRPTSKNKKSVASLKSELRVMRKELLRVKDEANRSIKLANKKMAASKKQEVKLARLKKKANSQITLARKAQLGMRSIDSILTKKEKAMRNAKEQMQDAKAKRDLMRNEYEQRRAAVLELNKRVKLVEQEFSKVEEEADNKLAKANKAASKIILRANNKLEYANKKEASLKSVEAQAKKQIALANKSKQGMKEIEKLISNRERTLAKDQTRLNDLRSAIQFAKKEFSEKTKAISVLNSKLKRLDENVNVVQAKAKSQIKLAVAEQAKLKKLRTSATKRVKLAEAKEAHLYGLRNELKQLEKAANQAHGKVQRLESVEVRLVEGIESLEAILIEKKVELQKISKHMKALVSEMSTLLKKKDQLPALEKSLIALQEQQKSMEKEIEHKELRISQSEKILTGQLDKIEQNKEKVSRSSQDLVEIASIKKQIESEIRQKQKLLVSTQRTLLEMKKTMNNLLLAKEDAKHQGEKLLQRERALSAREAALGHQRGELEKLHSQIAVVEEKKKGLLILLQEKKQVLEALKHEAISNKELILKIREEKKSARAQAQLLQRTTSEQKKVLDKLSQKEMQLKNLESSLNQKRKVLESLHATAQDINTQKVALDATLNEQRLLMAQKLRLIDAAKAQAIQSKEIAKTLKEHEKNAKNAATNLLKLQKKHDLRKNALDVREATIVKREKEWLSQDDSLQEAHNILASDKTIIFEELEIRKSELASLTREWDSKVASLASERAAIEKEKKAMQTLVNSDLAALKSKEDELIATIDRLEADKSLLEKEEVSLVGRVNKIEKLEAGLTQKREALNSRERKVVDQERIVKKGMQYIEKERAKLEKEQDKVYRAKELKKSLPKLERQYSMLQKQLQGLQISTIEAAKTKSSVKNKKKVVAISMKEKRIHQEARRLLVGEREVEALEARRERAFLDYLRDEATHVATGFPRRIIPNADIKAMIDDARSELSSGKLDHAVRMAAEVEYLVEKLNNANERRVLSYDLRDLKASIKLTMLS